ncbi:hypothetical protein BDV59DRAFT_205371 [Aspergillus ambiguus]|uniref:uncharacterized protein n=1 Tax=Aspergillus ambiguus TaxID=176160 RepID=UPI003CCD08FD
MEIVHGHKLPFAPMSLKHRGSRLTFKHLFHGDPSTPENYLLTLGHQTTFYSPRHRHNFDQFRFAFRGSVSLAPDILLTEGNLSYHPEGVEYGPQHDVDGERDVLVLQFGGASGQGYLSWEQIGTGQAVLREQGRMEGGKFFPADGGEAKDGFEALYETVTGRKLVYPEARYGDTVIVRPAAMRWVPVSSAEGVWRKLLGVFSEREARVELVRVADGAAWDVSGSLLLPAVRLVFVLRGEGRVGEDVLVQESAVRVKAGDGGKIEGVKALEMICFVLPQVHAGI